MKPALSPEQLVAAMIAGAIRGLANPPSSEQIFSGVADAILRSTNPPQRTGAPTAKALSQRKWRTKKAIAAKNRAGGAAAKKRSSRQTGAAAVKPSSAAKDTEDSEPAPASTSITRARKCSPFPRARSFNMAKLSQRERLAVFDPTPFDVEIQRLRPRTRGDCKPAPPAAVDAIMASDDLRAQNHCRPCGWVSCRHHNAFSFSDENGSIKEHFPHLGIYANPDGTGLEQLEALVGTCALDGSDALDDGSEGVAGLLALYQAATSGQPIGFTDGLGLEAVSKRLGISVERVRQLGEKALQEARVSLRRRGISGDVPRRPQHALAAAAEMFGEKRLGGAFGPLLRQRMRERYPEKEAQFSRRPNGASVKEFVVGRASQELAGAPNEPDSEPGRLAGGGRQGG